MKSKYGLEMNRDYYGSIMNLTANELAALKKDYPDAQFTLNNPQRTDATNQSAGEKVNNLNYYPKSFDHNNTVANFESFWVPKKGVTIELNPHNVAWYERVITADRKSTRLNSSHVRISYAVFCLKKKKN